MPNFKRLSLLVSLLVTFLCTNAFAGLWVEPLMGYRKSTGEFTVSNTGSSFDGTYEIDISGPEFGLKLGYAFPIALVVGLDYRIGSYEDEQTSGPRALVPATDNEYNSLGIFLGVTTVPLFNFWINYKFDFETETTSGDEIGGTNSGDGFGAGVGFTGLPFVSINLEYNMYTLDEQFDAQTGVTEQLPSNTQSEQDIQEITISVSVPFDFF